MINRERLSWRRDHLGESQADGNLSLSLSPSTFRSRVFLSDIRMSSGMGQFQRPGIRMAYLDDGRMLGEVVGRGTTENWDMDG